VTAVWILAEIVESTRSALRESSLALLSPMMISSELEEFSNRLDKLIIVGDRARVAEELERFGVPIHGNEPLKQIESVENHLLQRFDDRYNELINFMPENLLAFFKLWRQTWDAENLKILYRCIVKGAPYELRRSSIGLTGNLGKEILYRLAMSRRPQEYITRVSSLLPREITIVMDSADMPDPEMFDVAIDRAYVNYIQGGVSGLRLKDLESAWRAISREYEYRDIIAMARLKQAGIDNDSIRSRLILNRSILTEPQYEALINTKGYEDFYYTLLTTEYGEVLPRKSVIDPSELSMLLQDLMLSKYLTYIKVDEEESFIIRSMIGIQYTLSAMRRRIIFPLEKTP
jgi:vacuolar-type H+-ATPase subunit C/Vma6